MRSAGSPDEGRAEIRLDAALTSPREARLFVTGLLAAWGDHRLVEAAALLVSELVTNAVVHARSEVDVVLAREGARAVIRVEVADSAAGRPAPGAFAPDTVSGRGMALVDAFASRWGVDSDGDGKRIWFELEDAGAETGSRSAGPVR